MEPIASVDNRLQILPEPVLTPLNLSRQELTLLTAPRPGISISQARRVSRGEAVECAHALHVIRYILYITLAIFFFLSLINKYSFPLILSLPFNYSYPYSKSSFSLPFFFYLLILIISIVYRNKSADYL